MTTPIMSESVLEDVYELERVISWIKGLLVSKVALQFPDQLLKDAPEIALKVGNASKSEISILGDTSYGSCCVDVHAAMCVGAQALVHFGPACLSKHEKFPVLYIFMKASFEPLPFINTCKEKFGDQDNILIASDLKYHQTAKKLVADLSAIYPNIIYLEPNILATSEPMPGQIVVSGRTCCLPSQIEIENFSVVYIGEERSTITDIVYTLNKCTIYTFNPGESAFSNNCQNVNRHIGKRYFLVEKAKDAKFIGILVATLGVADHLKIIEHIKLLAKRAGKRCYTFIVGKLNPSKLANFPEIDCFVLIACPQHSFIDSNEFYRPIITPFEFELSVNRARAWTSDFVTDFSQLLPGAAHFVPVTDFIGEEETDVSLVSGLMRRLGVSSDQSDERNHFHQEVDCSSSRPLTVLPIASDFLKQREWNGLEPHVGETRVLSVQSGKTGLSTGYKDEGNFFE